jgi:uncharacterized protein YfaS (alpha-2-macroglobulin family)
VKVTSDVNTTKPGSPVTLHLEVTKQDGNPVPKAHLAVVAVDEALLSLLERKEPIQNPFDCFYARSISNVEYGTILGDLLLNNAVKQALKSANKEDVTIVYLSGTKRKSLRALRNDNLLQEEYFTSLLLLQSKSLS